jgi:hypothetical protein
MLATTLRPAGGEWKDCQSMLQLRIVTGSEAGRVLPLEGGVVLRIGRAVPEGEDPGTLGLTLEDARLSRLHCELLEREGRWVVRDLGSSNGTFLNAARIDEAEVKAGDVLQVGGSVLELHDEAPVVPAAPSPPPRRLPRRRPASRSTPQRSPYAWILAGVLAAGVVVWLAAGGRGREPRTAAAPSPPAASAVAAPAGPAAPPPRQAAPRPPAAATTAPAAVPGAGLPGADDDLVAELERALTAADWKRAARMLDASAVPPGTDPARLRPLRERLRAGAEAALRQGIGRAGELAAAGETARAREDLEALLLTIPDAMVSEVLAELERLGQLEAETLAAAGGEDAREDAAAAAEVVRFRSSLSTLASRAAAIGEGAGRRDEWPALLEEIRTLVRSGRGLADYARLRPRVRSLHHRAHAEMHRDELAAARFRPASISREADRVRLRYDFKSDEQVQAFRPVSASAKVRRQGNSLLVSGEARLGEGDPFQGSLAVQVKVAAGAYRPASPNINVALFTTADDRLYDPARKSMSLLNANVRGSGPEPDDFVVFGLGYRHSPVDYDGKPWEYLTVPPRVEPVPMPAIALLAGRRRGLLHTDQRECLHAEPLGGELRGPVAMLAAVEGGVVRWELGARGDVGLDAAARERLGRRQDRRGSVTLLTYSDEVRFTFLEVEGRLRAGWLEKELELDADRALAELER